VAAIRAIKGGKSVVRRTGRAERDQHAEPVSSSEYVVRVDMNGDTDEVRSSIRRLLGGIPGCSTLVGYPIAHRISAVLSGTETELAVNVYGEDIDRLRATVAKMKERLDLMQEVSDVRANREVTVRTLKIDYDIEALSEAGLTLREAGEQVSAAFNGVEVGEVREGLKIRSVTVRLEGFDNDLKVNDVGAFLLSSRTGRRVRLDDVARIHPEEASDLMLREGGRRKALISLNAAEGVDIGRLVDRLKLILNPIAAAEGMSVEYGGSYQARESAGERLAWLAAALAVAIFILLVFALKNALATFIALFNIPLALIGGVAAVYIADPVLSVSSLVGFVTVTGFVLRNGILLLQRYRELEEGGTSHANAIREGSLERMVPILMTSLTTVLGLVPIIMAGDEPGGELLAPIAVVQFGGILGAGALNLAVLPAAALLLLKHTPRRIGAGAATVLAAAFASTLCGCRSYTAEPIDWKQENLLWKRKSTLVFSSLDDVATSALVGNTALNRLRIERAGAENVAKASGWWEDPELDMDFMRIVNPADNPFLGGASLSFSIPLSGVPGLERKAAEAYSKAAQNEIIAAERETAGEARMAAVRVLAARRTAEILNRFENDERIVQAFSAADRLVDAGELPLTDLMAAKRRRHDRTHKIKTAQNAADTAECELKRILGVSPDTALVFRSTAMHGCSHTSMPPAYAALDYIRHPRVCAALDRFAGSEAALEAEIRRQYPDLKLGPAYSREEGLDRFGIVAGVTVPLWNRNRKGIAEAEGSRNILRSDAVAVWRETVTKAAATRQRLARLLEHRAESSLRSVTEANQLADAGELDALAFIAVREEILDAELNEMEWKTDICLVSEELEMTNPKE
jgi:outer membrane protein TolC